MFIITLMLEDGTNKVFVPFWILVFDLPEEPLPEPQEDPSETIHENKNLTTVESAPETSASTPEKQPNPEMQEKEKV